MAKLECLVRSAAGAKMLELDARTDLVVLPDGSSSERSRPAPLRYTQLESLPDLCLMAADELIAESPEVYFAESGVTLVLDRSDLRETVLCPLVTSEKWDSLLELVNGKSMTPAEAVRFMRFDLPGTGAEAAAVLTALRNVDFKRTGEGRTVVQHGRESLGRSVEAVVQNIEAIPETFCVRAPIFTTLGAEGFEQTLAVGIYVDVSAEKIHFQLLPDEATNAMRRCLSQIETDLRVGLPEECPLFRGTFDASGD